MALNKIDSMPPEDVEALLDLFEEETGLRPMAISGAAGTGVKEALGALFDHVRATRAAEREDRLEAAREDGGPVWTP